MVVDPIAPPLNHSLPCCCCAPFLGQCGSLEPQGHKLNSVMIWFKERNRYTHIVEEGQHILGKLVNLDSTGYAAEGLSLSPEVICSPPFFLPIPFQVRCFQPLLEGEGGSMDSPVRDCLGPFHGITVPYSFLKKAAIMMIAWRGEMILTPFLLNLHYMCLVALQQDKQHLSGVVLRQDNDQQKKNQKHRNNQEKGIKGKR